MEKGYYTDDTGLTHLIKGAYADTGDAVAHRVLKAYVGDDNSQAKLWLQFWLSVQSIAVITSPAKTVYFEGDIFDPAGMVVEAAYQTGGKAVVADYTYTPTGPLSLSDTTITIRYEINGTVATATLPITVTDQSYYVAGLTVTTPPAKTGYFYGDSFDRTGMTVLASYSDGSQADVTASCSFSPTGPLTLQDTAVTVSYTENTFTVTALQPVSVVRRLMSLTVETAPDIVEYEEDDVFSPIGMQVRAYYNDGTSQLVTGYGYSPAGPLSAADTEITVAYTENGVTQTDVQRITVKAAISSVLEENDWDTIQKVAAAGNARDYWSVGDEKDIELTTGEALTLQIYGFDHDDLADSSGKAPITFGLKNLMANTRAMNPTATAVNGFSASAMYTWLTGDLWDSLPNDLRAVIKPVTKLTSNDGRRITSETMPVFLMSTAESMIDSRYVIAGEGSQYAIFADTANIIKYLPTGTAMNWWTRSRYSTGTGSNTTQFMWQRATSYPINSNANNTAGVCFAFCI